MHGKLEIYKLEKNVSMLATISGAGPMTGFLRNSGGMIQAFHKWHLQGSSSSEGIYTAMTTTVVGWLWNYCLRWIQSSGSKTDKIVHQNGSQCS
jgi:biopolymer transport protein ExbB